MEDSIQKPLRQRRTRNQIIELIDQCEVSGLTPADFCYQHHINIKSFRKWKSRYKILPSKKKKKSGFTIIDMVGSSTMVPGLFAEVKEIKIYQPVSASFLKELL